MATDSPIEEAPRRRSARVVLRISILVRAADGAAEAEWEPVQTVLVSLHGAMIRTRQPLAKGAAIDIRMRYQERSARARVAWRSPECTEQGFDLGFEILDPPGFWEFDFPPDRWSDRTHPQHEKVIRAQEAFESAPVAEGSLLVRDYMTTALATVQETDTLLDATMFFVRSTFRHLPVVRGRQLVGVITERDVKQHVPSVVSGISAEDYNSLLETTPISRVMSRTLITVRPEQSVLEAAKVLYEKRLGCLPVVQDNELVGIITTTDMLKVLTHILENPDASRIA
jgi:CBS domain-containing protein